MPPESSALDSRLLTRAQLPELIGRVFSNGHLLRMEKDGLFPKRFYLSPRSPVWRAHDIKAWVSEKTAGSVAE